MADALACSLPSAREGLLLRALTTNGAAQQLAWKQWSAEAGAPRTAIKAGGHELKEMLPLLHRALEFSETEVDGEWRTLLRFASARENLRDQTLRRVIGETLSIVREHATPVSVVGGVALAHTVYAETAARHCDSLDLLIEPKAIDATAATLVAHEHAPPVWGCACSFLTTHAAGLPVKLRGATVTACPDDSRWQTQAFVRSREHEVCGVAVRVLAPDDMLLNTCQSLFAAPHRASLQQWCDAIQCCRNPALDWNRLAESANVCALSLPLWLMLDYLAHELSAPVPPSVLEELETRLASERWRDARRAFKFARARKGAKSLFAGAVGLRRRLHVLALYLQD